MWFVVSPRYRSEMNALLVELFGSDCSSVLHHQSFFPSPALLTERGIDVNQVHQQTGDLFFVESGGDQCLIIIKFSASKFLLLISGAVYMGVALDTTILSGVYYSTVFTLSQIYCSKQCCCRYHQYLVGVQDGLDLTAIFSARERVEMLNRIGFCVEDYPPVLLPVSRRVSVKDYFGNPDADDLLSYVNAIHPPDVDEYVIHFRNDVRTAIYRFLQSGKRRPADSSSLALPACKRRKV